MGKMLIQQKRGKGSSAYRRPSHRFFTKLTYRRYDETEKSGVLSGQITRFVDDPARTAILMEVKLQSGEDLHLLAPEGARVGDTFQQGLGASVAFGNVLPLSKIPDGIPIYNIEAHPGSGGLFVRAAGTSAYVVSHDGNTVTIMLPSKKTKILDAFCRAQIGVICGGGRLEKPMLKAGANHHKKHARNLTWPNVRGVAMNAVAHPYGGKQHHAGKATTVSRNAPPGRKVGHIAARSTGRRKSNKRTEKG
ncbi:MAG: 50S ribosomal protein L2 [Candidatus Micrarchaeota archaeon]